MKYLYDPPKVLKKMFPDFVWQANNNKILFTFDDGPSIYSSEKILKTLENNGIKALFFFVGENIDKNIGLAEEILTEGHLIGNHTFNHKVITFLSKQEIVSQIELCQRIVEDKLNYRIKYFRPPKGRFNCVLSKILNAENLTNIMWNLLTYDYKNDINIVKFGIDNYLNKNSIIVLHDSKKSMNIVVDSINYILGKIDEMNFEIGNPEECLK